MGFRFRKTIRLLPGVRLNIRKSGLSTSIGGRGATLNIGPPIRIGRRGGRYCITSGGNRHSGL